MNTGDPVRALKPFTLKPVSALEYEPFILAQAFSKIADHIELSELTFEK